MARNNAWIYDTYIRQCEARYRRRKYSFANGPPSGGEGWRNTVSAAFLMCFERNSGFLQIISLIALER